MAAVGPMQSAFGFPVAEQTFPRLVHCLFKASSTSGQFDIQREGIFNWVSFSAFLSELALVCDDRGHACFI